MSHFFVPCLGCLSTYMISFTFLLVSLLRVVLDVMSQSERVTNLQRVLSGGFFFNVSHKNNIFLRFYLRTKSSSRDDLCLLFIRYAKQTTKAQVHS
mmetsp:Transcript_8455/g.30925  ORF Transcript_8455/g.30925 Transcript_8455/m.30925 type:complete len:96 (+) Transcript_8455:154-441(+)